MPTTILSDDFNRANTTAPDLGADWDAGYGVRIQDNAAYQEAVSGGSQVNWWSLCRSTASRGQRVTATTGPLRGNGYNGSNGTVVVLLARAGEEGDNTAYLAWWWTQVGVLRVRKCTNQTSYDDLTNGPGDVSVSLPSPSTPTQYVFKFTVEDGPGTNETTLTATIATAADPSTILATATGTDTTPLLQRAGYAGFASVETGTAFSLMDSILLEDMGSPTPTAGTIVNNTAAIDGANHVVGSSVAAAGGVDPKTYSWHRSRTLLFTPGAGNVVAGQTGATLSVVAPDAEVWHYVRRVTDSSTPTPLTADSNVIRVVRGHPAYRIARIGDSISDQGGDYQPSAQLNAVLDVLTGPRVAVAYNCAKAGAYLANGAGREPYYVIQPGLSGSYYGDVDPPLTGDILSIAAANSCNCASIRLGTNDSLATTAEEYGAALDALIADLLDNQGMQFVVLHAPTFGHFSADSSGSARHARLESYRAVLQSRVNDTTVFAGDFDSWYYYSVHPELFADAVHFPTTSEAAATFARREAAALVRAFDRIEQRGQLTLTVRGAATVTLSRP